MDRARFVTTLEKTRCLLPPMTGYTDYPYRVILASFEPGFLMTEMVHSSAVVRHNPRTMMMIKKVDGPQMNGVQLLGRNPIEMAQASQQLVAQGFEYIDINMGCTSKKVTRRGEGVALMRDEDRAVSLVSKIVGAVDVPVTVKLRLGPSPSMMNYLSLCRRLQDAGVAAVTLHSRTGDHKFSSKLNPACIQETVAALDIPVIANGGIASGAVAAKVLEQTGCAGVMPGRYLIGNPWLVREIQSTVRGVPFSPPSFEERRAVCQRHLELLTEIYGVYGASVKMRSIFSHYFPSVSNRAAFHREVHLMNFPNFVRVLKEIEDGPWVE